MIARTWSRLISKASSPPSLTTKLSNKRVLVFGQCALFAPSVTRPGGQLPFQATLLRCSCPLVARFLLHHPCPLLFAYVANSPSPIFSIWPSCLPRNPQTRFMNLSAAPGRNARVSKRRAVEPGQHARRRSGPSSTPTSPTPAHTSTPGVSGSRSTLRGFGWPLDYTSESLHQNPQIAQPRYAFAPARGGIVVGTPDDECCFASHKPKCDMPWPGKCGNCFLCIMRREEKFSTIVPVPSFWSGPRFSSWATRIRLLCL